MDLIDYADRQVAQSRRKRVVVQNSDKTLSYAIKTRGLGYFRPFGPQTEIEVSHDVRVSPKDRTLVKTLEKSADVYQDQYGISGRIMKRVAELPDSERL